MDNFEETKICIEAWANIENTLFIEGVTANDTYSILGGSDNEITHIVRKNLLEFFWGVRVNRTESIASTTLTFKLVRKAPSAGDDDKSFFLVQFSPSQGGWFITKSIPNGKLQTAHGIKQIYGRKSVSLETFQAHLKAWIEFFKNADNPSK